MVKRGLSRRRPRVTAPLRFLDRAVYVEIERAHRSFAESGAGILRLLNVQIAQRLTRVRTSLVAKVVQAARRALIRATASGMRFLRAILRS